MRTRRDVHTLSLDALLTVAQAAELMNVAESMVRGLIRRGELKSIPWGKRDVRVPRKAITAWVDAQLEAAEARARVIDKIQTLRVAGRR